MDRNEYILVESLVSKYRSSFREEHYGGAWKVIFDTHQRPMHEVFMKGSIEDCAQLLRDPCSNFLHYGIDNTFKGCTEGTYSDPSTIRRLSFALGAEPIFNAEALPWRLAVRKKLREWESVETILSRIDSHLGKIEFPNPFPGEGGLITKRGIAPFRALNAIYQASLLKGRVVEIGGGVGRTAFYAQCFGVTDYTIVDLPFTALSQGYFLGKARPQHTVKLISPDEFFASTDTYDVAFNSDSLTELSREAAERYTAAIKARAKRFISINHEANGFTIRDLFGKPQVRCPYWLRDGYVEEHY